MESALGEKGWEMVGGSVGEELKKKEKELQARLELQEDQLDELKQRYRKGNIIISSPDIPGRKIKSLIRKEDDLRKNNISLIEHISNLIQTKYGVQIREEELVACHRLQNSTSVILKFGIRTENSAWSKLVQAIKSRPRSNINLFANFQLTARRSELMFQVRQLKKEKKIDRMYSDENGVISIRFKENGPKHRLTYQESRGNQAPGRTYSKDELLQLVNSQQ